MSEFRMHIKVKMVMELNKENIYKHATFLIGETLVDVGKHHISAEDACNKIRKCLQQMDAKLHVNVDLKDKTCKNCAYSNYALSCNKMYCYKYNSYIDLSSVCKGWEWFDE